MAKDATLGGRGDSQRLSDAHKLTSVVLFVLLHADGVTMGAHHDTRCGWGSNGAIEVGQGSVRGVPTNMQGMARCTRSKCDLFECDSCFSTLELYGEDEIPRSDGDRGAR